MKPKRYEQPGEYPSYCAVVRHHEVERCGRPTMNASVCSGTIRIADPRFEKPLVVRFRIARMSLKMEGLEGFEPSAYGLGSYMN
jgi:hypothetical protein